MYSALRAHIISGQGVNLVYSCVAVAADVVGSSAGDPCLQEPDHKRRKTSVHNFSQEALPEARGGRA